MMFCKSIWYFGAKPLTYMV